MGATPSGQPKSKSKEDSISSETMANYPRQPAPQLYPTQQYPQYVYPAGYPYQQPFSSQPMGNPVPSAPSAPGVPYGPPPPYTEFPNQTPAPAPPPQAMLPGQYPQQYPVQRTIVAPGLWDSGARFDTSAQPSIPPPPPGVTPNAVQLAAMQGHTIVGTQQRENFFTGNRNDGGYTFGF